MHQIDALVENCMELLDEITEETVDEAMINAELWEKFSVNYDLDQEGEGYELVWREYAPSFVEDLVSVIQEYLDEKGIKEYDASEVVAKIQEYNDVIDEFAQFYDRNGYWKVDIEVDCYNDVVFRVPL